MSAMFTKFADKPRPVLLDLKASSLAEQYLGYGLHKIVDEQSGPRAYIVVLWAGLHRKDNGITLDETLKLVQKSLNDKTLDMTDLQLFVIRQLQANGVLSAVDDDELDNANGEAEKESANPLAN